jgi:Tol biopolymer transport system component
VSGGTPIRWPAPQDSDLSTGVWSGNNRLAFFTGIGTQGSALPGTQFAVHIRDLHGRGEIVGRFPVATVGSDVLYWLPNGRGVLLDASWEKRGSALYSVPASGGATRPFGTDPQPEGPPAWSRNGRTITYIGGNHIMTAGEDGTDPKIVLTESTGDEAPSFSPDETQIVFLQGVSTVFQIATVPASGGTPTVLAPSLTSDAPAWSPDGSTIADIVFDNTTSTLSLRWIEPASGQTVATLPTGIPWSLGQTGEISLAWSPDGTHIAITGESGIYVLPVSPRGAAQLAIPIPGAEDPSYSPDGTQIAFDAPIPSTGTQTGIMIANTDGTNARVLSTAPLTASDHPAWQPNP